MFWAAFGLELVSLGFKKLLYKNGRFYRAGFWNIVAAFLDILGRPLGGRGSLVSLLWPFLASTLN